MPDSKLYEKYLCKRCHPDAAAAVEGEPHRNGRTSEWCHEPRRGDRITDVFVELFKYNNEISSLNVTGNVSASM